LKISEVNYGCCKAWIEDCVNLHGGLCTATKEPRRFSIPLTCIDCNTNEIKPISNDDRYAALSYVWGATTGDISRQDYGHVPVHTSQTIQDAMQVVRRLGIRYLWVDQYCVDQQNHDVKNIQIAEMDRVYAGAHVTIVAAAGSNAEYGLPGVSRPRSHAQPTLAVDNLELASSLPFLARVMKNTTWSKRAWTYQEAVLSLRCLFFTEYQVYYTCHQMTRCEAVRINEPLSPDEDTTKPTLGTMNAIIFGESQWDHGDSLGNFTSHVAEYTKRSLKYSSDILNAFRGLLSRSPLYSFCGIPIDAIPGSESDHSSAGFGNAFAVGLDWVSTDGVLSRNHQFPSWSWAGWKGSVHYVPPWEAWVPTCKRNTSDTIFYFQDTQGDLTTIDKAAMALKDTKIIPELSYSLVVEAQVLSVRFRTEGSSRSGTSTTAVYAVHPESMHDHTNIDNIDTHHDDANFFGELHYDSVETRTWDCVLMFTGSWGQRMLMIIECEGDVAIRVGTLNLWSRTEFPTCRKRIRMV
jgi:hypothetical protein